MATDTAGVVNPDELYTLDAFKRRLNIREATLRSARRAGLRVYYVHKHAYVHGRDWIEYVLNSKNCRQTGSVDHDLLPATTQAGPSQRG